MSATPEQDESAPPAWQPRTWRSAVLVWPLVAFVGFFGFAFVAAAPAEATGSTGDRVVAGVTGALLLLVCGRLQVVGLRLDRDRVRVRNLLRTRSVPVADVAGLAVETSVSGGWRTPAVVTREGRTLRARWLGARPAAEVPRRQLADAAAALTAAGAGADPTTALAGAGRVVEGAAVTLSAGDATVGWQRITVPQVAVDEFAPEPGEQPVAPFPERLDRAFRLDRRIAADLVARRWGFGEVGVALLWLAAFVAAAVGLASIGVETLAGLVGEAGIGVAAVLGARTVTRHAGGLRPALGWSLPGRADIDIVLRWTGWAFLAQLVATLVVLGLMPEARDDPASNTDYLEDLRVVLLLVEIPTIVLLAPVVEELFFRGLVLRAAMRRFAFWPSAVLTSCLFGLAHAPAVDTGVQAVQIAISAGVFGVIQCMLVRRTASLGPAIATHALHNAIAVTLTFLPG